MTRIVLPTKMLNRLLQEKLTVEPTFLSRFDREADALPLEVQVRRHLQQEQKENDG